MINLKLKAIALSAAVFLCFRNVNKCFAEEASGVFYKDILLKAEASVMVSRSDNLHYIIGYKDGSVAETDKDFNFLYEIFKAEGPIVDLVYTQQFLVIITEFTVTRIEKENNKFIKQSPLNFGTYSIPLQSAAFSTDNYDSYLILTDTQRRPRVLLNNDRKTKNSGDGLFVGSIFSEPKKISKIIPYGDMLLFFGEQITKCSFQWNVPAEEDEEIQAGKKPVLLSETVVVPQPSVCGALSPHNYFLYYVVNNNGLYSVYKYDLYSKEASLFYETHERIYSILTASDGIRVFLLLNDRVIIVRDEYAEIYVTSLADTTVDIYINGSKLATLSKNEQAVFIRKPGTYTVSSPYSSVLLNFDAPGAVNGRVTLEHKESVTFTVTQEYPMRIQTRNSLPSGKSKTNNDGSLLAALGDTEEGGSTLFVMDTVRHKILFTSDFKLSSENIHISFHADIFVICAGNLLSVRNAGTGEEKFNAEADGHIKGLAVNNEYIVTITDFLADCYGLNGERIFTIEGNGFTAVEFINRNLTVSDTLATRIYKIDEKTPVLYRYIPQCWTDNVAEIIPVENEAFAVLDKWNSMKVFNGTRQVEPSSTYEFKNRQEYLFLSGNQDGVTICFRDGNRIVMHNLKAPGQYSVIYTYLESIRSASISEDRSKIFISDSTGKIHIFSDSSYYYKRGFYSFFQGGHAVYITPQTNNKIHDSFIYCSPNFPRENLLIRQGNAERVFTEEDEKKLKG